MGRALALALGARGYDVVVSGANERALGRVVGEIVCGGGQARHIAGNGGDPAHIDAALEKTREAFGELTLGVVVATDAHEMTRVVAAVREASKARIVAACLVPMFSDPLPAPGESFATLRMTGGGNPERFLDLALFVATARSTAHLLFA
jgi:NAD(P)-dependent dehydrogenase (short-subunit alcohol dehydrogenase family)